MDKKTRTHEPEGNDSISEKRRKLLKTAATTAPVIATLQSGAAFANTSAFQCINDAKSGGVYEVVTDPVPSDNWVRKTIKRYKQGDQSSSNPWWYDVDNNGGTEGTYYRRKNDGTLVSEVIDPDPSSWTAETVHVIVYYQPSDDYTQVTEVGIYPKYYVPSSSYGNQLPINGSCLASMA